MVSPGNWLQVVDNEQPKLNTLPSCVTVSDIKSDNYVRLIATDIAIDEEPPRATLKVFRGIDLESEHELKGIPSAIVSLYIDDSEPKTPIVAVAIAEAVLFYRHIKPYFKYTLPELPVLDEERDIWRKLNLVGVDEQEALIEQLKTLERPKLTRKSQHLLNLLPPEMNDFIRQQAEGSLIRYSNVVALKCLARVSSGDSQPPSHLVIATDMGEIIIVEPQSFGVLYRVMACPDITPSMLAVNGCFETDFCIAIATRYGSVYLLRKTATEGQEIFKLSYPLTGLVLLPIDQTIVVSSMDKKLVCYSKKGKQLYMVPLAEQPICMTMINLNHLGLSLICVALEGGLVQFYMQKYLVDEFQIEGTVSSMVFGYLGLEEHVLCLTTLEGDLIIKILKRTATFEPSQNVAGRGFLNANDMVHSSVLEKPKKSSIFVEQVAREKQNAKATYGSFQVELWRLRHTAARATVDALNSSERTISGDITHAPVKLSAEVCGVGPVFRLYLTIQNLSTYKMASNLMVLLHANRRHYTIQKSVAKLPSILPGVPLKIDFEIVAVLDPNDKLPPHTLTPENSHIRVMITKTQQTKPLIAAVIAMPQSEANF
ncbi:Bardet-Biedl syndrome 1 protein homolog [Musca vetustissima]|uniref:Bardet-Biedl syndrome 1 protein homolog n=1 Tax=Musca vetustissima TaxID=27455 RepID=UPI002AB7AD03|nr:Bardet-Biedl syndrome 1 protein homolog [Musca vetustissima]